MSYKITMKQTLTEIYDYRQMIVGLVRRDLREH